MQLDVIGEVDIKTDRSSTRGQGIPLDKAFDNVA